MVAKILFLVLLGTALVFANPIEDNEKNEFEIDDVQPRGVFGTFQWWLVKADQTIGSVYDRFKKVIQLVVETGEGVMDYTKEKLEQLRYKYYEIKSKSEENMNSVKNHFITKVVGELQHMIDVLNKQNDEETCEKHKQKAQELAESSKKALEKLRRQLQASIETEKRKLEENLNEWKQEADRAAKKRQLS